MDALGVTQGGESGVCFGFELRLPPVQKLDVGRTNDTAGRRQGGARNSTLELANVAWPVIRDQQVVGLARELLGVERQTVRRAVAPEESIGEDRNVHRRARAATAAGWRTR